jgi:hypothetical protein
VISYILKVFGGKVQFIFEIFKMRHRNFYLSILYIFAFILLILFFNYEFDGSKTNDFENYQKILVRFLKYKFFF